MVTATNVFKVVCELGIKPWLETRPNMPLAAWLRTLEENNADSPEVAAQKSATLDIYTRFGPKPEVQFLAQPEGPKAGKEDIFFRMVYKPWVTVVGLVPDSDGGSPYIPLAVEWKQGNRLASIVPVSGIAGKAEAGMQTILDQMLASAEREYCEETGWILSKASIVGSRTGFYDQVRGTELRFFAAAGIADISAPRGKSKFDENEFIKLVLMRTDEWLALIEGGNLEDGFCLESCAATATYLALRNLQLL